MFYSVPVHFYLKDDQSVLCIVHLPVRFHLSYSMVMLFFWVVILLQPQTCRWYIPPKCWYLLAIPHDNTTQNINILSTTRTSIVFLFPFRLDKKYVNHS